MSDQNIPDQLRYTDEHEWVERVSDTRVRIGITEYAQSKLGDIVFVQLPEVGSETETGEPFGEVESPKSVSDLFAPLTGALRGCALARRGRHGAHSGRIVDPRSGRDAGGAGAVPCAEAGTSCSVSATALNCD